MIKSGYLNEVLVFMVVSSRLLLLLSTFLRVVLGEAIAKFSTKPYGTADGSIFYTS